MHGILFREFTDYLLGRANTTLDFECIPHISNTLPVTLTDMDGIVVIPLYNMITGIDLNKTNIVSTRYYPQIQTWYMIYGP